MPPNYIPGVGPFEPKLMIVGDYPTKTDNETGQPFSGYTGSLLDQALRKAGITRSDVYCTYAIKYQPPLNDPKHYHMAGIVLEDEIRKLWDNEIHRIKPNCILAIGNTALEAVSNVSGVLKWRGSILTGKYGYKVIPTISFNALNGGYGSDNAVGGLDFTYSRIIEFDIARAVEESETNRIDLPSRELRIAHSSLDLYRFFRQYENLDKCAVDIESINCVPVSIGFAFNPHHAISVPLYPRIGTSKLSDMSDDESDECWRIIDKQLRRLDIIGQNFKYDEYKLGLIGFKVKKLISDTLIKTRVLFPELPNKGLGMIASLWTREPYYKDDGKEFKFGKEKFDNFLTYNARDCAVTFDVDQAQEETLLEQEEYYKIPLRSYYYDYMMKKHAFYLKMENVGFRVDLEKKLHLSKTYTEYQRVAHARLVYELGEEVNVKSYPQIYNLLYKTLGFKPYKKDPTSEDSIVKLIQTHCKGKDGDKKKEILELLLEERRIRDQRSRYINFTPDYDGRCKSSFNISATETCRSSTSILNKPIRPGKFGLAFHTISKHGRLAKDIRSMFIPDKGKVLLQADSSQAEARVVAVLAEDYELLEAFDKIDIHRRTAGLIFGLSSILDLSHGFLAGIDTLEKDGPERFCGKKTRHAGNYDMGHNRFMTEFNTDSQKFEIGMTISAWKAEQMLKAFHAGSPKLRENFHCQIQEAIKTDRTLIDPFGGVRVFHGRMGDDLFKEAYANIPQRTVAHLVQKAGLAVDAEIQDDSEACFISENHDALVLQVPENNWEPYAKLLKQEMQRPIDFSLYCTLKRNVKLVIPADVEISDTNYGEMRKVKI